MPDPTDQPFESKGPNGRSGFTHDDDDEQEEEKRDFFNGAPPLRSTVNTFLKWLKLDDPAPIYAVLGTVAANYLDGDPVWLLVIAPPSSAKTEILNALSWGSDMHYAATITQAALLSGAKNEKKIAGTKGGLLREIGKFGILIIKDFGSILSMRSEVRSETLAALREVYDGRWTRRTGADNGAKLHWEGKVGLIGASTQVYDDHHGVIAQLGDRFLLCRLPNGSDKAQARLALRHAGEMTQRMRDDIAQTVAALFIATAGRVARPIFEAEEDRLIEASRFAIRLRAPVVRDARGGREIESVHDHEGPARMVLALERLLAGLDILGMDREAALVLCERIAMDSVPQIRRRVFDALDAGGKQFTTKDVATYLGLPTGTTRRVLEDLAAQNLVVREHEQDDNGNDKPGVPDYWRRNDSWINNP